jgi:multiple sugar transport system substrate-binding protein
MNNEMMLELSRVISDEQSSEAALTNLKSKYETLLQGQLPLTYQ